MKYAIFLELSKISLLIIYHISLLILGFSGTIFAEVANAFIDEKSKEKALSPSNLSIMQRLKIHHTSERSMIPTFIGAEKVEGEVDGWISLKGNAQIRRIDGIIKGDTIIYCNKTGEILTKGKTRIIKDGMVLIGSETKFNLHDFTGFVEYPKLYLPNGIGYILAKKAVVQKHFQKISLERAIYTGCNNSNPCWKFKTSNFDLNLSKNEWNIKNGFFYFKNIPLFFFPYAKFPIKKERRSGFLSPTYEILFHGGSDFILPYYFNLSKNQDLTISPKLNNKLGLLFDAQFRYLENNKYSGKIDFSFSPRKFYYDGWTYHWKHKQALNSSTNVFWIFSKVSKQENLYYSFLENKKLGSNHPLDKVHFLFKLESSNQNWNSYFQIYKPYNSDSRSSNLNIFDKIPEISLSGNFPFQKGFNGQLRISAARFKRNDSGKNMKYDGNRFHIYPSLSYPIRKPGWFIKPKIGIHHTQYQTKYYSDALPAAFSSKIIFRNLPIFSLDAEMKFEKKISLFNSKTIQLINPHVFYLHIPYLNQERLPIYDTLKKDFNFAQAFEENSYSGGWDRISHANKLVLSLTSTWINENTGSEKISISGLQSFSLDKNKNIQNIKQINQVSDFLFSGSMFLTNTLNTAITFQVDPYERKCSRSLISAYWKPNKFSNLSISYRYQRPVLFKTHDFTLQEKKQLGISFQCLFSENLCGIGKLDYELGDKSTLIGNDSNSKIIEALVGVEYRSPCWLGRFILYKNSLNSLRRGNMSFIFQIELSGLGSIGTNPIDLLKKNVPGYQVLHEFKDIKNSLFQRYE